jgi:enoyl-CoA hydratase/carnithine racemase
MTGAVGLNIEAGLAILTLARPEVRNALSVDLLADLNAALDHSIADPTVKVVVLTAAGKAFCAGLNLKTALDDPEQAERFALLLANTYRRLLFLPIPLLCAVDGPAMGGGVGLALAADLVWAGPGARFAFPETRLGLVPALVSVVARRRMTHAALMGMALGGHEAGPADALRLGLADMLSAKSAIEEAVKFARGMLRDNSPEAMRRTKAFLQSTIKTAFDDEIAVAVAEFRAAAATESCRRGLDAFRAKRSPEWGA